MGMVWVNLIFRIPVLYNSIPGTENVYRTVPVSPPKNFWHTSAKDQVTRFSRYPL